MPLSSGLILSPSDVMSVLATRQPLFLTSLSVLTTTTPTQPTPRSPPRLDSSALLSCMLPSPPFLCPDIRVAQSAQGTPHRFAERGLSERKRRRPRGAMAMAAAATLPSVHLVACSTSSAGRALECRNRVEFSAASFPSARVCRDSSRSSVWSVLGGRASSSIRKEGRWQAVAEQLQAETESDEGVEEAVSSDTLAMHFEAEGTIADTSVPKLTKTLEAIEGVSNVEVYISEGGATVRLTKQMNVQATGVASGLVEVITKGGFKLQALNLGFDEDGEDDEDLYDYDMSSYAEEEALAAE